MKMRALLLSLLLLTTTSLFAAPAIGVGKRSIAYGPYAPTLSPSELVLVSNGNQLLFVWTEVVGSRQRIFTAPYRAFGAIDRAALMTVPASELGTPNDVTAPALAREGDGFRAAWIERHSARIGYVTAHVTADGKVGTPTILRQALPSDEPRRGSRRTDRTS